MKRKHVVIELFGRQQDMMKLLNDVQRNHAAFKFIVHSKKSIVFETNRHGLRILRANRRKYNCKFTVNGVHDRRWQLFSGYRFILILLVPYIASLFIWTVEVETSHPEIQNRIEHKLKKSRIAPLQLKKNLPNEDVLRRNLMEDEGDLSWIRFEKQGVKFAVIPMQSPQVEIEKEENRSPSHLVAKTSGVITHFSLSSGEKVASLHSTVEKGDLLATGILEQGEKEVVVGAKGAVYANYWLEYSFSLPRTFQYKIQGEEKMRFTFNRPTFGKNLFNKENWNIIETDKQIEEKETNVYLEDGMEKTYIIPIVKMQLQRELGYEAVIQKEELLQVTYQKEKVTGKIVFLVNDNIATYEPINQGD
ncbi:MAG TPA: sporulation protein YqfD [Sporosarcina sp.]|nr:sporulation protein YqfD [Sporosarcina sp.]